MIRLPRDRKSRIQLGLISAFLIVFAAITWGVADYFDWIAQSVDLRDAISRGDLEAVKRFERDGIDWRDLVDLPNNYSALHQAVGHNDIEMARYFIENGADITAKINDGTTPAGFAAIHMHLGIMKYLLMETARGETIAQDDQTLYNIGQYADLELIAWLSQRVDLKDHIATDEAYRLLYQAVRTDDVEMVKYLLAIGTPEGMRSEAWDEGFYRSPPSGSEDASQWLALHNSENIPKPLFLAARRGNEAIVKLLLDHGADPALKDLAGKTAADYAREEGHDAVAFLLKTPMPVRE